MPALIDMIVTQTDTLSKAEYAVYVLTNPATARIPAECVEDYEALCEASHSVGLPVMVPGFFGERAIVRHVCDDTAEIMLICYCPYHGAYRLVLQ